MKPAALTGLLLFILAATANAQLTLLPQIGLDRSKTSVSVNDLPSFSPMGAFGSFKAGLRLDYRFKSGHGPYLGLGTSSGPVAYSFSSPSNALNDYKALETNKLLQLEAGYQYSFKPIRFRNSPSKSSVERTETSATRSSCGSYYRSHCGEQKKAATTKTNTTKTNTTLRIQPSAGLAYHPAAKDDISLKDNVYQYNAGAWKTAFVTGAGFEFGRGRNRLFTLSVFYTHPLGNDNATTLSTIENTKPVMTSFSSSSSSWGMSLGVPISLSKTQKPVVKKTEYRQHCRYGLETRSRCATKI